MLADKLRGRGIVLAEPASSTALNELKSLAPGDVFTALYENIYQWFDGFADSDFDEESFVRIWPIRRLVESAHLANGFFPFADFSLDSEIYGLISGQVPTVFRLNAGESASVTIDKVVAA